MLRTFFVLALAAFGAYYALQAPFYALLFYIGNAYFRPEEWVWSGLIKTLNFSLISGWFVILASLFTRQRFIVNGKIVLLFLFLLHTFVSTQMGEHFEYSWGYWLDFFKVVVITYLIVVLVKDPSQLRLLLLVMVLALGLEQAKQGWFHLITAPAWPNTNPVSFLGDNNGVAVGMLMLVPIITFFTQTIEHKWARVFFWGLLIGVIYRALSTFSRGGFLGCLVLGASYWLRSRHKVRVLIGLSIVSSIALVTLPDQFWHRMGTIPTYKQEEERSAISRIHFWKVAVAMANRHPLLGVGHKGYSQSYDAYDFSQGKYGTARAVHSSIFGVLAESGYIGGGLYILILLLAIRSCRRICKLTAEEPQLLELHRGAVAIELGMIVFLISGSFISFQYNEMLWHYIGISIALEKIYTDYYKVNESERNVEDFENSNEYIDFVYK